MLTSFETEEQSKKKDRESGRKSRLLTPWLLCPKASLGPSLCKIETLQK